MNNNESEKNKSHVFFFFAFVEKLRANEKTVDIEKKLNEIFLAENFVFYVSHCNQKQENKPETITCMFCIFIFYFRNSRVESREYKKIRCLYSELERKKITKTEMHLISNQ